MRFAPSYGHAAAEPRVRRPSLYRSARMTVMWLRPFWTRVARPIARGRHRRMCLFGALSTKAVSTKSASTSTPGLCVLALATALSMSFLRIGAAAFCVNSRSCNASPAWRPRTRSAIMRALRGLIRVNRAIALLTMVGSSGRAVVPTGIEPIARGTGRYGRRRIRDVAEKPSRRPAREGGRREGRRTLLGKVRHASVTETETHPRDMPGQYAGARGERERRRGRKGRKGRRDLGRRSRQRSRRDRSDPNPILCALRVLCDLCVFSVSLERALERERYFLGPAAAGLGAAPEGV